MGKINNTVSNNSVYDSLTKFQGFYTNIYRDPFINGTSFIFITKPLLFIDPIKPEVSSDSKRQLAYLNMTRDPKFVQYINSQVLNNYDKEIVNMLSYKDKNPFKSAYLPMFTNECKNFDSNDTVIEQTDIFETKQGFKESLPTFSTTSESSNSLSISVTEDANLSFTKLLTLWVNYISNINDGTFDANPDMILNGILDYMCSIYYFVLAPDGKTLKYWCRYTGCWPTSIPYSNLRYSKGQNEPIDLNITFQYTIKEDMDPKLLEEFNILSLKVSKNNATQSEDSGAFSSVIKSPYLNIEEMKRQNILTSDGLLVSDDRDPLIVYINEKINEFGTISSHFELLFNNNGYSNLYLEHTLSLEGLIDDYYFNDKETNFLGNN